MPSSYTENYQLSQWERTDKVLMEDFNADNAKLDAALKAEADARAALTAAVAKCGNCKIIYGSYTGAGKSRAENPNTMTFPGKPLLIIIMPAEPKEATRLRGILVQGAPYMFATADNYFPVNQVTWSGNSVSWYNDSESNGCQMNATYRYVYVALLAADQ